MKAFARPQFSVTSVLRRHSGGRAGWGGQLLGTGKHTNKVWWDPYGRIW